MALLDEFFVVGTIRDLDASRFGGLPEISIHGRKYYWPTCALAQSANIMGDLLCRRRCRFCRWVGTMVVPMSTRVAPAIIRGVTVANSTVSGSPERHARNAHTDLARALAGRMTVDLCCGTSRNGRPHIPPSMRPDRSPVEPQTEPRCHLVFLRKTGAPVIGSLGNQLA